MKTLVKSLIALAFTGIILSGTAFTSNAAEIEKNVMVSPVPLSDFNMIVLKGNVRVTLIQTSQHKIVADNEIDAAKTSFQQKGHTLYICSNQAEPLEITVYVNDLRRIDATNGAKVTTRGQFNLDVLQVFLKDDATAKVTGKIKSLYTVTEDYSRLKLIGSAEEHILVRNQLSQLDTEKFAAVKTKVSTLKAGLIANTATGLAK